MAQFVFSAFADEAGQDLKVRVSGHEGSTAFADAIQIIKTK